MTTFKATDSLLMILDYWAWNLETGLWKQGNGELCITDDEGRPDRHCCLGVAAETIGLDHDEDGLYLIPVRGGVEPFERIDGTLVHSHNGWNLKKTLPVRYWLILSGLLELQARNFRCVRLRDGESSRLLLEEFFTNRNDGYDGVKPWSFKTIAKKVRELHDELSERRTIKLLEEWDD